jgi:hypothetical protein
MDTTLGFVRASARRGSVSVGLRLARPARVSLTISTRFGDPLRRVRVGGLGSGAHVTRFAARDGRGRRLLGTYDLRVSATSDIGTSDVSLPLSVRR